MLGVRESYSEQKRPVSGQCGVLHHHHRVCFFLYLSLSFLRNRRASAEFEAPGIWIYSPPHSYSHPSPHLSPLSSFPWAHTVTDLDADACYHWVSPWIPTWSLHPWSHSGTVFKPWWCVCQGRLVMIRCGTNHIPDSAKMKPVHSLCLLE